MSIRNLLTNSKGLGWEPNPPDKRDLGLEALGLSSSDLPDEVDLTGNVAEVRNQRSTNSCVGQSLAAAVCIRELAAGLSYAPASALFPYYHARRMSSTVVVDGGTYIRLAVKAMVKLGIPDEEYWPFGVGPLRVNRRPGWEAHMRSHPRRGGTYYHIEGYSAERVSGIRAALAAGHPVVFGTPVTRAFTRSVGATVIDQPIVDEPIAGGHAMTLVGYRVDADEGLIFRCLNSWGSDWRDGGLCWLTESYVRWRSSRDFTVVVGWDRIARAVA